MGRSPVGTLEAILDEASRRAFLACVVTCLYVLALTHVLMPRGRSGDG